MSALVSAHNPSREDFAALLDESYGSNDAFEGTVVKGIIVAIEKDVAVIDIGLKTEGRVPLKEFTSNGREPAPGLGDEVEVYPRARRERARRGRHLARQGAPRGKLGQARKGFRKAGEGRRRHHQPGQGRLHGRPRRGGGVPAPQPGRHPPCARRHPADGRAAAVPDPQDGPSPRQHRRVAPHRAGRIAGRAAP